MSALETEGKTVEEAVDTACRQLGLPQENVTVEILQEPKGILGMTTRKARVRVTPKENGHSAAESEPEAAFAEEDGGAARPVSLRGLNPDFDPEDALLTICRYIDDRAEITSRREEDRLVLSIACDGSGIFIGHRGQTLDALQYLVNRMAGKQNPTEERIIVDSENYRERKAARLVDDAWAMAQAVKRSGRPVVSEPMSAFDRRIIHTTLREDDRVMTRSLGEGEFKRVQVLPNNTR